MPLDNTQQFSAPSSQPKFLINIFSGDTLTSLVDFILHNLNQFHDQLGVQKCLMHLYRRAKLIIEVNQTFGKADVLKKRLLQSPLISSHEAEIVELQREEKLALEAKDQAKLKSIQQEIAFKKNLEAIRIAKENELVAQYLQLEMYEHEYASLKFKLLSTADFDRDHSPQEIEKQLSAKITEIHFGLLKKDLLDILRLVSLQDELQRLTAIFASNPILYGDLIIKSQNLSHQAIESFNQFDKSYLQNKPINFKRSVDEFENRLSVLTERQLALSSTFKKMIAKEKKIYTEEYPKSYAKFFKQESDLIQQSIDILSDYAKKGVLYLHWRHHQSLAKSIILQLKKYQLTNDTQSAFDYLSKLKILKLMQQEVSLNSQSSFLKRINYILDKLKPIQAVSNSSQNGFSHSTC